MSKKGGIEIEADYQVILEKLSKDKEEKQKGLEELRKRKREIQKLQNPDCMNLGPLASKPRQTMSSERREQNNKIYEHLLSPKPKEIKSPKVKCHSRFEEEALQNRIEALNAQRNRLKMLDKQARYAGIVKEIFVPSIDPKKRQEVEDRINYGSTKVRSAYNSRGNSAERESRYTNNEIIQPSYSQASLRSTEGNMNAIKNAARVALESPRNRIFS